MNVMRIRSEKISLSCMSIKATSVLNLLGKFAVAKFMKNTP